MILLRLVFSILLLIGTLTPSQCVAQTREGGIRINQLGYYPSAPKHAFVVDGIPGQTFEIISADGQSVFTGTLSATKNWQEQAAESGVVADFSGLTTVGKYTLKTARGDRSYPFEISPKLYEKVLPASVKSYYFQRAGIGIPSEFGSKHARPSAHPDDAVYFHRTSGRDTTISYASPGGWYDAGDFNKYIVNAGYSVGLMLQLLDQYPEVLPDNSINFPEAGNGQNDLLDELKYELDWMLTMQDPEDGGVHHKLTTERFQGMVMPHEASAPRYILAKSTTASLDFSACMAIASRVFTKVGDSAYAKTCLDAASSAFNWANKNPEAHFKNPAGVSTGEYGDQSAYDEFIWASAELYLATKDLAYWRPFFNEKINVRFKAGENWTGYMANLAAFSLLDEQYAPEEESLEAELLILLKRDLIKVADALLVKSDTTAYGSPITDWHWGSSSDILGAAMFALQAYKHTGSLKYLQATQRWTDLIFGYNATGYSWVTGFGSKQAMNIHHRQSAADDIAAPVPGFIIGGPNSRQQDVKDGTVYTVEKGQHPMKSYADQTASYASNEVCLNWNAPLVYVLGMLEHFSE